MSCTVEVSVIDQVINQLLSLQQQVLQFAHRLGQLSLKGTPGQRLLKFADTIPADDLHLMQQAILQDCKQIDLDEW